MSNPARWYTWVIFVATGASVAGLSMIVFNFDPLQAGRLVKFLFFCSIFVFAWGVGTLVFLGVKNNFAIAFRRGFWLAVLALGAIIMSRLRLLNILNFPILFGVIAAIEWFLTKTFGKKERL